MMYDPNIYGTHTHKHTNGTLIFYIYDDNFKLILNDTPLDHPLSDERLLDIFETSCEVYLDNERSEDGAIIYTLPPLDDMWLNKGKHHAKQLEVAKEHSHAHDQWKFEAEPAPVPILSIQMSDVPLPSPQYPSGPMVSDDKSSCSSESSDDDSVVLSVVNNTHPVEWSSLSAIQ